MYNIVITGGSKFDDQSTLNSILDQITAYIPSNEVLLLIPGHRLTVEALADNWASSHQVMFDNLSQSLTMNVQSNFLRKNKLMIEAKDPDLLVVFPIDDDGMEANDLIQRCLRAGITVQEVVISDKKDDITSVLELREIELPTKILNNIDSIVEHESTLSSNNDPIVSTESNPVQLLTNITEVIVNSSITPIDAEEMTKQVLSLFDAQAQAYKKDFPGRIVNIPKK